MFFCNVLSPHSLSTFKKTRRNEKWTVFFLGGGEVARKRIEFSLGLRLEKNKHSPIPAFLEKGNTQKRGGLS